jgi:succinate dehydrogenase / fumarate reductase cytochrome b subunit
MRAIGGAFAASPDAFVAHMVPLYVILAPFHGVYGLFITGTARPNVVSNAYVRNWMYFLQGATGVIVFAFILFHIGRRGSSSSGSREPRPVPPGAAAVALDSRSTWPAAPATFHLANGIAFSIAGIDDRTGRRSAA